jgi:hypothetical protein
MRELVHGQPNEHYLEHRGYRVYRGKIPLKALSLQDICNLDISVKPNVSEEATCTAEERYRIVRKDLAYQTWGIGALGEKKVGRFAVVPIEDYSAIQWYATIPLSKDRAHVKTLRLIRDESSGNQVYNGKTGNQS